MTLFELDDATTGVLALFVVALIAVIGAWVKKILHVRRVESDPAHVVSRPLIGKLSSEALAGLMVEALVENKLVDPKHTKEAQIVLARRIDLRKALGDY